jgi:hypothetical protein
MTLDTLSRWRLLAPVLICGSAATPSIFFLPLAETGKTSVAQFLIPVLAGAFGFLYSMLHVRDWLWKPEKDEYVRRQINQQFLEMIPAALNVTPNERERLVAGELSKELRGVFWESIDGDPELREQKQFFCKSGILYTSAIDGSLILPWFGVAYYILGLSGFGLAHFFFGTVCFAIFGICLFVIIPKCRAVHLRLSNEQLEGIHLRRRQFVESRFTDIINGWRQTP